MIPHRSVNRVLQLCDPRDSRRKAAQEQQDRVVKLKVRFQDKSVEGTGFWISSRCVITAAHNIFDDTKGQFAKSATVVFNGEDLEVGEMFTVQGFIISGHSAFDYGALRVNRSPRDFKAMGYGDNGGNGVIQIPGFPDGKSKLVTSDGSIMKRSNGQIQSRGAQTTEGESGAPMHGVDNIAFGIHTGGHCENEVVPINEGVQISGHVQGNLDNWK
jgi:V8-like Glu-specific endopeptidase